MPKLQLQNHTCKWAFTDPWNREGSKVQIRGWELEKGDGTHFSLAVFKHGTLWIEKYELFNLILFMYKMGVSDE